MKEGRPTSFDIAYRAGVSQSTVSRALRDSPEVNPATRQKVQRIAQELNYRVDRHARALRCQSTQTLALLIFEDPTPDDSRINPFFLSVLGHIIRSASARGYDLLVSFQQLEQDWHTEYELSARADGLILLGYGDWTRYRRRLKALADAGACFVLWGPSIPDTPGVAIGTDNFLGGRLITEHLLELGHRRFAFLGNAHQKSPEFLLRYQGHCAALEAAGLDPAGHLQLDCDNEEAAAKAAAARFMDKGAPATALVCASDLIAIAAMGLLRQRGLALPEALSITGFDDIAEAAHVEPGLTTIHQDTLKSSGLLVDALIALVNGEPAESQQLAPALAVRSSAAGPPPPHKNRDNRAKQQKSAATAHPLPAEAGSWASATRSASTPLSAKQAPPSSKA